MSGPGIMGDGGKGEGVGPGKTGWPVGAAGMGFGMAVFKGGMT